MREWRGEQAGFFIEVISIRKGERLAGNLFYNLFKICQVQAMPRQKILAWLVVRTSPPNSIRKLSANLRPECAFTVLFDLGVALSARELENLGVYGLLGRV